jgi:hypothetical protein
VASWNSAEPSIHEPLDEIRIGCRHPNQWFGTSDNSIVLIMVWA